MYLLLLLLTACEKDPSEMQPASLVNSWRLVLAEKTATNELFENPNPGAPSITFVKDSSIRCFGGCNHGGGRYVIDNEQITIRCSFTRMACIPDQIMDWEIVFYNINSAESYKIEGNLLTIYSTGEYNLIFNLIDR